MIEEQIENQIVDRRTTDHDLIVTMHEQLKQVRVDIKTLTDGTSTTILDHERRLRLLEAFKSVMIGGLILSNVIMVPIIIWLVIRQFGGLQ